MVTKNFKPRITTKKLESERLILRKVMECDALSLFENWDSDIEMHKWVGYDIHTNVEETKLLIEKWIAEYETGRLTWIIEEKSSGSIIGVVSASNNELTNKTAEVGFSIGTKFQGKGYGVETLITIINYLLIDCDLQIIKGGCYSYNVKSANTMIKAGMKEQKSNVEGTRYFTISKNDMNIK